MCKLTCRQPEQFKNSKVQDFFDFSFTALPHKVLAEEEFYKEVGVLRRRFVDSSAENFILSEGYRKDIPADGFLPYAERIWVSLRDVVLISSRLL